MFILLVSIMSPQDGMLFKKVLAASFRVEVNSSNRLDLLELLLNQMYENWVLVHIQIFF